MNHIKLTLLLGVLVSLTFFMAADANAQNGKTIEKKFSLPDDTYKNGDRISVKIQYYEAYGDNHRLVAMTPEFVTIQDDHYTIEIEDKYYKGEYYIEVLFDDGYVTPRLFLSPVYEYLPNLAYVLLGAVFIAVYSRIRFNRWTEKNVGKYSYSPRNYTTWTRFIRSLSIYIILTELVYFSILISPSAFIFVNNYLGGSPIEHEALKEMGQYGVLWSILLLTGVLPNFPWINKLEQKFRETLHDYAFIPAEAKAVISQLEVNLKAFHPDPKIIEAVRNNFDLEAFGQKDFTKVKNSIAHKWCKLSYLRQRLQDWHTYPKINRFFGMSNETSEQLIKGYDAIKNDIVNYNEYQKTGAQGVEVKYKQYLKAAENYINTELNNLLKIAYSLICIGVLGTEMLPAGRKRAFRFFGLRPYLPEGPVIDWDTNLKSLLAITVAASVPTLFYYFAMTQTAGEKLPDIIPSSSLEALFWSIIAIIMHGLTVIVVVLFNLWRKTVFTGANYQKRLQHPKNANRLALRVIAGVIGYGIGFFTLVAMTIMQYYFVAEDSGPMVMKQLGGFALWAIIPFVTGYFIQYYLETPKQSKTSNWRFSIQQGAVTAFIAGTVAMIILDHHYLEGWYFIAFCILMTFCIGSGIGYVFPGGYRRKLEASESPEENRRVNERIELVQPATLKIDKKNYACNVVEISMSGAKLDRKIICPLGTKAQIDIPRLGKLNAFVVRIEKKNTVLSLPYLDRSMQETLSGYLERIEDAA
ncbi:MAG: hypothetical protein PVG19_05030 [Desulfobacterales bacterium]|jgi:hypothetical protein